MGKDVSASDVAYRVLNPAGLCHEVTATPLAARIPVLTDKVVYCVSQVVMGADILLEKIANALPEYAPGVTAVYKRKVAAYMTDEPELWDEITSEADAVVYGCGA